MAWYELAKVGTFKDRAGQVVNLTKELLQKVANNYNAPNYAAPITVGHPRSAKEPAWGRVDGLKFENDKLLFKPGTLVAEFAEMVNKGMYNNVSAGINLVNNTLDHVAFLGAQAPAIKGLERITAVEFSAAPETVQSVDCTESAKTWLGIAEFSSPRENWLVRRIAMLARIMRRIREEKIATDGIDAANQLISDWEIDDLTQDPPPESSTNFITGEFSTEEPDMDLQKQIDELTAKVAEFSQKVTTLETENTTLKTELSNALAATKKKALVEFCDNLIREGRLVADAKDQTVMILESLDETKMVEFSEPTGVVQVSALEAFKKQLAAHPVMAEFSELMTHGRITPEGPSDQYAALGKSIAESINPKQGR
jgi:hypothetical protein